MKNQGITTVKEIATHWEQNPALEHNLSQQRVVCDDIVVYSFFLVMNTNSHKS